MANCATWIYSQRLFSVAAITTIAANKVQTLVAISKPLSSDCRCHDDRRDELFYFNDESDYKETNLKLTRAIEELNYTQKHPHALEVDS